MLDFSNTTMFDINREDLNKYIDSLDLLSRLKNGRAVFSVAEMDCRSLWTNLNIVKMIRLLLRRN